MKTIPELAEQINHLATEYPIGGLQTLRKSLRGNSRTASRSIFDARTIFPTYAFHVGGRSEMQFNIALEDWRSGAFVRYGLGFSLKPSQSLPDISVLFPKIGRFNEYVRAHREKLLELEMWHYRSGMRCEPYLPTEIQPALAEPDVYIFLGLKERVEVVDPKTIVKLFDRLLPLYEFVESTASEFPHGTKGQRGFDFKPGCTDKPARTKATSQQRVLDITLRHNEMQRCLYCRLAGEYGASNVGTEIETGNGTSIDVVLKDGLDFWFYEIKTAGSIRGCIREALPQLLEYSYWPGAQKANGLIIVGTPKLDNQGAAYLEVLREQFRIPIRYEDISIEQL